MTRKCSTGWQVKHLIQVLLCILSSYLLVTSFKETTMTQLCMLEICVWTIRTSLCTTSTHAVKDRPDFYTLASDHSATSKDIRSAPTSTFLPTMEDCKKVWDNYVLVARVLVDHLTILHPLKKCVPCHVEHKYSSEMSNKSEIVTKLADHR